jgi:hypothetical protein
VVGGTQERVRRRLWIWLQQRGTCVVLTFWMTRTHPKTRFGLVGLWDDKSAQPRPLSTFDGCTHELPSRQFDWENLWLKFSLVRDGASLQTHMSGLPSYTILAIETPTGKSLDPASSPWRHKLGFYGSKPALYGKCGTAAAHKVLFIIWPGSAEFEIDVYMYSERTNSFSVSSRWTGCRRRRWPPTDEVKLRRVDPIRTGR